MTNSNRDSKRFAAALLSAAGIPRPSLSCRSTLLTSHSSLPHFSRYKGEGEIGHRFFGPRRLPPSPCKADGAYLPILQAVQNQLDAAGDAQFVKDAEQVISHSNPAYVVDLGTGALRWITAGCMTTCILNFVLGIAGGKFSGGTGVAAVSAFSLMFGYALVLVSFHRQNRVPFSVLLPRESAKIILSSALGGLLVFPYLRRLSVTTPFSRGTGAFLLVVLLAAILIPMWVHPLRRRLWRWALSRSPV